MVKFLECGGTGPNIIYLFTDCVWKDSQNASEPLNATSNCIRRC